MTNKDELEKKISHITIHALNQLSFDRVDVGRAIFGQVHQ
jgi:hypothetical protein